MARSIEVFFYGSFMIPSVREQHGFADRPVSVARLPGYDIRIDPLTRIFRDDRSIIYGVVSCATHDELRSLYSAEWMDRYNADPVLVELTDGSWRPVLTYLPDAPITTAKVPASYSASIVDAARALGFPDWYVDRLQQSKA